MTVSKKIYKGIDEMNEGTTFKYGDLLIDRLEYSAASKAIERLIKKGTIKRISTGIFYKPKKSVFGEMKPSETELIRLYLFDKGYRIAYVTGSSLYNKMGLTTQLTNIIQVASREKRIITKIGNIKVKAVKSYVDVSDENYKYLEILDAFKDFKIIPDLDKISAISILKDIINNMSNSGKSELVKYALKYPPRVKALLGAIFEDLKEIDKTKPLMESLNPLTVFKIGIDEKTLSSIDSWNIK